MIGNAVHSTEKPSTKRTRYNDSSWYRTDLIYSTEIISTKLEVTYSRIKALRFLIIAFSCLVLIDEYGRFKQ